MDKPSFTLASHFQGKAPFVRETYDKLLRALKQFGPIVEEPKKTSIHLVNATALAGVATRRDSIILTIKSDRVLRSSRIHKSDRVSVKRFHHEVKLTSPEDIDAELLRWLKAAYDLSG
jgi:uncharacterized protein DUF5655